MYSTQKLLEMIVSDRSSTRYDACEWLRVSPTTSSEIVHALHKASHDPDPAVASRAAYALQADVHHRQAVQMGLASPDSRDILPAAPDPRDATPASPDPRDDLPTFPASGDPAPAPSPVPMSRVAPHPSAAPPAAVTPVLAAAAPALPQAQALHLAMLKDIRGWGLWSLVWGALSLFASGIFSSPWGLLLIIVGLASFFFRTSSMYVIYGVTLAWAALHNVSALEFTWIFFSLFQVYATVRVFMNFRRYRKAEQEHYASSGAQAPERLFAQRAARYFPWLAVFLSSLSFIVVVIGLLGLLLMIIEDQPSTAVPNVIYYLFDFAINIGILGFSLGLASLLSHYRPKILGILAVIAGSLVILVDLGFLVLRLVA